MIPLTAPKAGGRRSLRAAAAAGLLIAASAGLAACGSGPGADASPPTASSWQSPVPSPQGTTSSPNTAEATDKPAPPPYPNAETVPLPRTLELPSIGAGSDLMQVGLRVDGVLEVPPGNPGAPAAWYTGSPRPGDTGPAVILGHVNAEDGGPGVFANLRELKPGDEVRIQREDGSTAAFIVVFGEPYPKDAFPTGKVYGNTEGPELRLITCDGYDPKTGTFEDNYVVYASLAR